MRWCALLVAWLMTANALAQDLPAVRDPSADGPASDLAFADVSDPNPGSGKGLIIAGWITFGIGVAGTAQAPLCRINDFSQRADLRHCRNTGIAVGVIGLAFAATFLSFGYLRRSEQRAWKKRHGLDAISLDAGHDSMSMRWTLRF